MSSRKSKKTITVDMPADLGAFWERKLSEMRRRNREEGVERKVSSSSMFRGLVAFWRAMDTGDINENK